MESWRLWNWRTSVWSSDSSSIDCNRFSHSSLCSFCQFIIIIVFDVVSATCYNRCHWYLKKWIFFLLWFDLNLNLSVEQRSGGGEDDEKMTTTTSRVEWRDVGALQSAKRTLQRALEWPRSFLSLSLYSLSIYSLNY